MLKEQNIQFQIVIVDVERMVNDELLPQRVSLKRTSEAAL